MPKLAADLAAEHGIAVLRARDAGRASAGAEQFLEHPRVDRLVFRRV